VKISLVFITILFLLLFSCAGTPDSQTDDTGLSESVELADEPEDIEDEIITEIAELEPEDNEEEQADNYIEEQIIDTEELAEETEELSDGIETVDLIEQSEDEPVLAETPVQITQPPVSAPPVVEPQTPPVAQTPPPAAQAPQPAPTPPTETRQPPLPAPALLGPAEENPPSQRETVMPRVEPRSSAPQSDTPAPVTRNEIPIQPVVTPQSDGIVFSRTVRATVGQIIEIPFTGTGWIYMGELASRRGIVYNSTRRDPEGQSIIFGAEEAGTYVLRFFKENFLSGYIQNDYVQVIVGEAPAASGTGWFAPPYDRGRVVALPRWPSALDAQQRVNEQGGSSYEEPAESTAANTPSSSTVTGASSQGTTASQGAASSQGTVPSQGVASSQGTALSQQGSVSSQGTAPSQGTASSQGSAAITDPGLILRRAGDAFTAGNIAAAIALLDQLKDYFPNGTDELYWLYGQFYEANSPSRNILLSLDYYRRLVNEYPQSSRYNDARSRIAYLERFYININ